MNHFDAEMATDATLKKMWTAPKLQVAAAASTESGPTSTTEFAPGAFENAEWAAPAS
jgi:hypothetical protein